MSAALEVAKLSRSFGGVAAVDALDFVLDQGRIHAVIGPNGAGKTTLFNLVTGVYAPDTGRVLIRGTDLTALPTAARAAHGLQRTFQTPQIFHGMSALENVMAGRFLASERGWFGALLALPRVRRAAARDAERATALMVRVGLERFLDAASDAMPYGALKRLEIARALAAEPSLLLLDEPAAGLNPAETAAIGELIRSIAADGITIVLVEHDMRLVMSVSQNIIVLDRGRKLAEGDPAEIRANPDVVRAYLGTEIAA
jgi:branched-chain amino acid transport system ATP-binding protein